MPLITYSAPYTGNGSAFFAGLSTMNETQWATRRG